MGKDLEVLFFCPFSYKNNPGPFFLCPFLYKNKTRQVIFFYEDNKYNKVSHT